MEGMFVKNFIIIGLILGVAFFSQNANLFGAGKTFTFVNDSLDRGQEYTSVGTNWLSSRVFPSISGEAQKRGGMVADGINQTINETINEQKQKVSESIAEKIKNYFSGITNSILHPGTPQNCEPPETSSIQ